MLTPESFIAGKWVAPGPDARQLFSPIDGAAFARIGGVIPDPAALLTHAAAGGAALRAMNIHDRARMIKSLALYLDGRKSELYDLNPLTGATRAEGWPDIDGGIVTMLGIASKARREMPDGMLHLDGGLEQLSRDGSFVGQHIATPLQGVAVQINAFNFPIWGMLEKLAPALAAGLPSIIKPASQTGFLAAACFRMIVESGLLPDGAVQLVLGDLGPLLDHLGPQDVVGFTGSAETALHLRGNRNLLRHSIRFIAEQDSLNAAILGPDVAVGSADWDIFLHEVISEMTTKAGQKCTAIRRIMVPKDRVDAVADALLAALQGVHPTDPREEPDLKTRQMGLLVSPSQRADVMAIAQQFADQARTILAPKPTDLAAGLTPGLYREDDPTTTDLVHEVEAFGPIATLMPYADTDQAIALANRGGGSLVASVFTSDPDLARDLALGAGAYHGRLYFNNAASATSATGHGAPLPMMIHGGPGRAGGGEELGGLRGILHYMQRSAIQANPDMMTAITGQLTSGATSHAGPTHPFRRNFHDLQIGETLHTESRRVTLDDIEEFAHFTGDKFYAHMDEEAAQANPFFPGRVAHGYLLLSFAAGLFVHPDPGPVLANTGLNALSFQAPVSPGDQLSAQLTVKRKTRRTENYGEVTWDVRLTNQHAAQVARYELLTMVAYEGGA